MASQPQAPSGARILLLLCAVAALPVFTITIGFLWALVLSVMFVIMAASVKTS